MSNTPTKWAIELACERSKVNYTDYITLVKYHPLKRVIKELAHMIERYEKRPVDPLLLEARKIASSVYKEEELFTTAEEAEKGKGDNFISVRTALKALKLGAA